MGSLIIDRDAPSFEGGVAHVWLETAAPADAAAERLAETRIEGLTHRSGLADAIPFAFDNLESVPANARLRAWVDVGPTGEAGPGDLYSTEATRVADGPCRVRVERIRS